MLQRAEGGIDLTQKEILPAGLERLPQTEHTDENYYRSVSIEEPARDRILESISPVTPPWGLRRVFEMGSR